MFGSQMLEVAIGLVFIYLILSIIVSAITELISRFFQLRSRNLKNGIDTLLVDAQQLDAFYDFSLIDSLSRDGIFDKAYNATVGLVFGKRKSRPSNIPPSTFSQVLIEINNLDEKTIDHLPRYMMLTKVVAENLPTESKQRLEPTLTATEQLLMDGQIDHAESLSLLRAAVSTIPDESVRSAVLDAIKTAENSEEMQQLYANVQKIADKKLREALISLVDAADGSVERFRSNVEIWFNNTMESCQAWYKRQAQLITLCIALVLPIMLNVDSVLIFNSLTNDSDVRLTVVNAADDVTTQENGQESDIEQVKSDLASLQQQLIDLKLMGWPSVDQKVNDETTTTVDRRSWPTNTKDRLMRIFGWLVTGIAASVGAPTWFDLLNKLVDLRSAPKSSSTADPDLGEQNMEPDALVTIKS